MSFGNYLWTLPTTPFYVEKLSQPPLVPVPIRIGFTPSSLKIVPSWELTYPLPKVLLSRWFSFFPTCQVRVVRFYVSTCPPPPPPPPPPSPSPLRPRPPPPLCPSVASMWVQCDAPDSLAILWDQSVWRAGPQLRSCEFSVACRTSTAILWVQCGVPDLNHDPVSSVWRAGPHQRLREFSVACRTSTAIVCVQCGVPDLNRDPVSSVWRAGPQPRSCEISVACRTSTAILWVQCGVPDLNRDPVSSVWRAGPQPQSCVFSVACRTSTAIVWVQCGVPDLNRDYVCSVWRAGPQVMCQKMCQRARYQENVSERMSEDMSEGTSERMSEKGCQKGWRLACVWLIANFLTSYSAFGFNRLSAERSCGIRDGWNSLEVYWHVWFLFPCICLTGRILTCFGMFEHALLLLQTFDLPSGGLLTCLLSFSSYMFDRSYPDMFWHVWACARASGGLLTCLISVSSYMFDRSYPDMFWHVWACAVAVAKTFDLASGGLLTCLLSVSSYTFDRSYPDMFWHVWACAVAAVFTSLTGVLLMSSGQEMTSVQQIAKMICPARRGAGLDSETKRSSSTNWPPILSWIHCGRICHPGARWQPSPENLHPTCHGGDHSK